MATPLRWLLAAALLLGSGTAAAQQAAPDVTPARAPPQAGLLGAALVRPVVARRAPPAQSRRFDPTGEDRLAGTQPIARRRAVTVVVFYGGPREGQGRLASPAQPVFVGVNLRGDP